MFEKEKENNVEQKNDKINSFNYSTQEPQQKSIHTMSVNELEELKKQAEEDKNKEMFKVSMQQVENNYTIKPNIFIELNEQDTSAKHEKYAKRKAKRERKAQSIKNLRKKIYTASKIKYPLFNNIGNYIVNNINLLTMNNEDKTLYKKAIIFIENDMLDQVVNLQFNGYVLPNSLQQMFDLKMFDAIQNNSLGVLEKILKNGQQLDDEYLLALSFSPIGQSMYSIATVNKEAVYNSLKTEPHKINTINQYEQLLDLVREKINDKEFLHKLVQFWWSHLEGTLDEVLSTKYIKVKNDTQQSKTQTRQQRIIIDHSNNVLKIPNIFQSVDVSDYMNMINSIKKYEKKLESNHQKNAYNDKNYKTFNNELNYNLIAIKQAVQALSIHLSKNIDALYSNNMTASIFNTTTLNSTTKKLLPHTAQELINNIYNCYNSLEKEDTSKLATLNINQIDNIMTKRLPEIIEQYLSLDKQYRNTILHNNGKTGEQMMIESLTNINDTLNNYMLTINEDRLKSLSVTQRYTNELKLNSTPSDLIKIVRQPEEVVIVNQPIKPENSVYSGHKYDNNTRQWVKGQLSKNEELESKNNDILMQKMLLIDNIKSKKMKI